MKKNKKIAIVGLGYVGLPLAAEFGKHHKTFGFDIDKVRIEELENGIDKTGELSFDQIKESKKLELTSDINNLKDCSIFIVTVPTPIDESNRPDLTLIKNASQMIGKIINKDDIIIYESTVYPGCTEEICVPILEQNSKLKFNQDFYCGYSPERINPGDKVNTLTKIIKITSGSTPKIANEIDNLYKSVITAGTYKAESIKVAEAAKVIENTQRDLNIALINELSVIFDKIDIDTIQVLKAASSKWNFLAFKPGLVGGHCIGVDPYYLTHKAEQVGYNPQVILAGRRINDGMASYAVKKTVQAMINNSIDVANSTIGILGITFKEDCPDIRNSKVFNLIKEFENWGVKILIEDPVANPDEVYTQCGYKLTKLENENKVDAIVVAVGHSYFRNLSIDFLKTICKHKNSVIADLKSIYDKNLLMESGFTVYRL